MKLKNSKEEEVALPRCTFKTECPYKTCSLRSRNPGVYYYCAFEGKCNHQRRFEATTWIGSWRRFATEEGHQITIKPKVVTPLERTA